MPIKVSKFVWENDPKAKPRKAPKPETIKEDKNYILLTEDGTLKVAKSQYTEDMLTDIRNAQTPYNAKTSGRNK